MESIPEVGAKLLPVAGVGDDAEQRSQTDRSARHDTSTDGS